MTLQADARAAAAELDYLVATLQPPCRLSEYALTGTLSRSATAAIVTARGPAFEGVFKLSGSGYAPILQRELNVLNAAARADVEGVIRPLRSELLWLSGNKLADRPVAAIALPHLSGGDLTTLVARASRVGALGPTLALQVARRVAEALRGLLVDLEEPITHGDLRAQDVLLPSPDAPPSELVLIDLAGRHDSSASSDVQAFGELLTLVAAGAATDNRAFDTLVRRCTTRPQAYVSMADSRLWTDLKAAVREETRLRRT